MKKIITIGLFVALSVALMGQLQLPKPELNPFHINNYGLFNPNQLDISHSMGFEASSSSTGNAYYLSRYTNHIKYKFNPKLDMQLDLNFVNFGSATTSKSIDFNDDNKSSILPAFSLSYRPNDNIRIDFRYEQAYSPDYYNRHWGGNWDDNSRRWYSRW